MNLGRTLPKAIAIVFAVFCPGVIVGVAADTAYPDKMIKIIVGLPAGTAPDTTARVIAEKLQEAWGKPVVVENLTGAAGNIAADRVAKSAPDGYTLFLAGNASIVVNLNLYEKLPYDPVKGPGADLAGDHDAEHFGRAPRRAGEIGRGAGLSGARAAGRVDVRSRWRRHLATSGRRTLQAHGRSLHPAGRLSRCDRRRPGPPRRPYRMWFCNITNVLPLAREGKLQAPWR